MCKYFWLVYILICCLQISLVFRFLLTLVNSIPQTNQQAHVALIPIVFKQRLSSLQTMVTTKTIDKTSNPDPSTYHPTLVLKRFYISTTKRKRNILGLNYRTLVNRTICIHHSLSEFHWQGKRVATDTSYLSITYQKHCCVTRVILFTDNTRNKKSEFYRRFKNTQETWIADSYTSFPHR